jgi:hypothetical protein
LQVLEIGGGRVAALETGRSRMTLPPIQKGYADAQLDDYRSLPRRKFPWGPPLRMRLRARASHIAPLGTLGFGFWNDPFTLSLGQGGAARRLPAAPNALWFFYASPPNDMALDPAVPGHGWKAASLRSPAVPSPLLALPALAAAALAQVKWLRRPVMQTALRFVRAEEQRLETPLDEWHTYELHWQAGQAAFYVDSKQVHTAENPPSGPLGFVTWIDNQYAIASPQGGFHFGTLATPEEEWLEVEGLSIEPD